MESISNFRPDHTVVISEINLPLEPVGTTEITHDIEANQNALIMDDITSHQDPDAGQTSTQNWLATGGIIGAILASTCCIVPLVLISLGVSGAWIGNLTALEAYKPIFIGVTVIFLAAGFWHVYFKKPAPCDDGSYCARPVSSRITQAALWVATLLVLLALTIDLWAPLFY